MTYFCPRTFRAISMFAVFVLVPSLTSAQQAAPVQATTANGDVVVLHPNGRWEYRDAQKAAVAKQVSDQYPENQACPPGSQGRLLGIGRCIPPGDKDFNRGTLNPGRR